MPYRPQPQETKKEFLSMEQVKRTGKAVSYTRYNGAEPSGSIDNQLQACKEFAEKQGFEIVETYIELGKSGRRTDNRPMFQQMIRDAESGKFSHVIVYGIDRFSRSVYDTAFYSNLLGCLGIKLLSIKEDFGAIFENPMFEVLAQIEKELRETQRAQRSERIKQGKANAKMQRGDK
jgi:site-specific DNA recombinase